MLCFWSQFNVQTAYEVSRICQRNVPGFKCATKLSASTVTFIAEDCKNKLCVRKVKISSRVSRVKEKDHNASWTVHWVIDWHILEPYVRLPDFIFNRFHYFAKLPSLNQTFLDNALMLSLPKITIGITRQKANFRCEECCPKRSLKITMWFP